MDSRSASIADNNRSIKQAFTVRSSSVLNVTRCRLSIYVGSSCESSSDMGATEKAVSEAVIGVRTTEEPGSGVTSRVSGMDTLSCRVRNEMYPQRLTRVKAAEGWRGTFLTRISLGEGVGILCSVVVLHMIQKTLSGCHSSFYGLTYPFGLLIGSC